MVSSEATLSASVRAQHAPAPGLVNLETSDTSRRIVIPASELSEFAHRRRCSRMKRSLIGCARLVVSELQRRQARYKVAFITLTYKEGVEWKACHISQAVKHARHFCARRGWRLVNEWKAELTKRGRLHYHLVCWLPKGLTLPMFDKCNWWPHGLTQAQWARNPVGYVAKYVSKLQSEKFPKGVRMHGRGGLDSSTRQDLRYLLAPKYVRDVFEAPADVVRAVGGGWLDRLSGEWIPAISVVVDWSA